MVKYHGDTAAFLGRQPVGVRRKSLVKVGYTNDPERRLAELNAGIPPAAAKRWGHWLTPATYPTGEAAKTAEDALKAALVASSESLGGEFFLGDEIDLQLKFANVPGVAGVFIRGRAKSL